MGHAMMRSGSAGMADGTNRNAMMRSGAVEIKQKNNSKPEAEALARAEREAEEAEAADKKAAEEQEKHEAEALAIAEQEAVDAEAADAADDKTEDAPKAPETAPEAPAAETTAPEADKAPEAPVEDPFPGINPLVVAKIKEAGYNSLAELPNTREELIAISGIGDATAESILALKQ